MEFLRNAKSAATESEKSSWLEKAEKCLRQIAPSHEESAAREEFDALVRTKSTLQAPSKQGH
jgi:hypothetical protein